MKIFFDSNVYIAEAIRGRAAMRIVAATLQAKWRVFSNLHLLAEVRDVLIEDFDFSHRLAVLAQRRILQRTALVGSQSSAQVPGDPEDDPILQGALTCGADYLVTNDRDLLELDPFQGLRMLSMADYHRLLENEGLL